MRMFPLTVPETENENNEPSKRKLKSWVFVKVLTLEEVQPFLEAEKIWSKHKPNTTESGLRYEYRCNRVKRRGPQCAAAIYLLYHNTNTDVSLFKTTAEHDHDTINEITKQYGINKDSKEVIKDLLKMTGVNWMPKAIIQHIQQLVNSSRPEWVIPKASQLSNYLAKRKATVGSSSLSFATLVKWCEEHSELPANHDETFVVSYQININSDTNLVIPDPLAIPIAEAQFRLYISMRRLIKITSFSQVLQADSTYKLIWNNFPVQIAGISDLDRVFHPFGIAVCTNENEHDYQFIFESVQVGLQRASLPITRDVALLADAADAITNGFKSVFYPDTHHFKRGMCWFHMEKGTRHNATDKIKLDRLLKAPLIDSIMKDVTSLQLAPLDCIFEKAAALFLAKWKANEAVRPFLNYCETEWLKSIKDGTRAILLMARVQTMAWNQPMASSSERVRSVSAWVFLIS